MNARVCLIMILLTVALPGPVQGENPDDPFLKLVKPTFTQHCVKCHGQKKKLAGDLNLLAVTDVNKLTGNPELLQSLIDALEYEEMPPEDEPALDDQTRKQLVLYFEHALNEVVKNAKTYSQATLRRMNRFQYSNAVEDLFRLNRVVFTLPERMAREHNNYFQPATGKMPDVVTVGSRPLGKSQLIEKRLAGVAPFPQDLRAEHGYDNRGDHLSLSPLLLEAFMTLSRSIVESPDFDARSVGIWKEYFAEPASKEAYESEIRARLEKFLTRAFRRPPSEKLLDRYTNFVSGQIDSGETFTNSMKAAASGAIASPMFLYLYEAAADKNTAQPIEDYELASRLSFFLWGSIPDETLLTLCREGKLHDPEVLSNQVDRMMKDRKLKRFCDSFPSQWLQLERIISAVPNRNHFPEYYFSKYRSSMHLMLEPLLLFETVLIEDRSIVDLIDPDFSYRSDRMEILWYGRKVPGKSNIGPVTGIPFRRVEISDRRQGGVITNAAIMSMNSGTEETKPITRGAWIAAVIFNDPPEPPPADVPPLSEKPPTEEANLTLRERLALHRERADCAGCHEKIDPFGFAVENFDAIGKWRDKYENGRDVDSGGVLFRKHKFSNVVEFKDAIVEEKDRFTRAFASHLLSFSLARELTAADSPALDQIVTDTIHDEYHIKSLLNHIVLSEPFLTKTNPGIAVTKHHQKTTPTSSTSE